MTIEELIKEYTENYKWYQELSDNTNHKYVKGQLRGKSCALRHVVIDLSNLSKNDE